MELTQIIQDTLSDRSLKKIVFSKPSDKSIVKATAGAYEGKDGLTIQLTLYTSDNKAKQKNYPISKLDKLIGDATSSYRQIDIITENGSCTAMINKSGDIHIKNNIKRIKSETGFGTHNREKRYILSSKSAVPFLCGLDICSAEGRIFDKKQPKFRQINRFLEIIEDVSDSIPKEGTLHFVDLCCGKAYLTFAVYWYFTEVKKRKVEITGVDLKGDVIEKCSALAKKIGYDGMKFICTDALKFVPEVSPDMVISLHACDIATDIVLAGAVRSGAKIILSTPCCHHEMFGQISSESMSFITDFPILKQKLCDAATDALRSVRLEIENYSVSTVELIDPDETPKNVLIRAIKKSSPLPDERKEELKKKYKDALEMLGVKPKLDELLK